MEAPLIRGSVSECRDDLIENLHDLTMTLDTDGDHGLWDVLEDFIGLIEDYDFRAK